MEPVTFEQFDAAAEQAWDEAQLDISSYCELDEMCPDDIQYVESLVATVLSRIQEELCSGYS